MAPQLLKELPIAQGMHRLPKTAVMKVCELPISGQALERLLLPEGDIAFDAIDHCGFEHKEAPDDPADIALELFLKSAHGILLSKLQVTIAPGRLHWRNSGQPFVGLVMGNQGRDIHNSHTISVGKAEAVIDHVVGTRFKRPPVMVLSPYPEE